MIKKNLSADYRKFLILFPVILSLIVLWNRYGVPDLSADGVTYLQISRNILFGKGLGWQALWASPLHSILVAAVSYVSGITDLLVAASLTGPAMALILVAAVYKLAENLFDHKTALLAASITAISPYLLNISYSTEPEITYTALLLASLALFSKAVTSSSHHFAALSGISFALAYLGRSEGFLIMVLVFFSVTAVQGMHFYRTQIFRLCTVATIAFFITAAPYLFFLHANYGAFVISPKASYVIKWIQRADLQGHDSLNEDLWGLNAQGKLKWQEPRGVRELMAYLMVNPAKSISVYLHNLSLEIPGRIPNNSGMERYPQLIPIYLALAALASLFFPWGAQSKEKRALLLSPLLIFFVLPVFTPGWWKYLVPYLPLFILLASKGLTDCCACLEKLAGTGNRDLIEAVIISLIFGSIAVSYYTALHPPVKELKPLSTSTRERTNDAVATRDLGTFAAQRFGPGRNYMARWSKVIYYLNGFWTPFPIASHAEVLRYARQHKVDYILLELRSLREMDVLNHPQPGLELVDVIESQEFVYKLAFYRLAF